MSRPLASVSLDVDNLWSYMKTHGDAGWESRPTYLPTFSPIVLESLDRLGIKITFFIVGVDAAREENVPALRAFVTADEFSRRLRGAGYGQVESRPFILGGIALHWAK